MLGTAYLWVKTLHVTFVISWMAAVFYLPRILVNIAEARDEAAVRQRLIDMGRRLYRFGHFIFGIAFLLGLTLWLYFHISGGWLYAKLALVALLLAHFTWAGRLVKRAAKGQPLPQPRTLRLMNEVPVLLLVGVLYLVLGKPF
ncbi:MAG: CopD family protein [Nevskiaceae bacterium]|nr:MAG: CopD family protein [Nevskiaceae bacterium]TBR72067.1 MAG: CopD family protein [Nevskiaceae bacterium]